MDQRQYRRLASATPPLTYPSPRLPLPSATPPLAEQQMTT